MRFVVQTTRLLRGDLPDILEAAVRMLLELAIGDAYGAAFEYVSIKHIRAFHTLKSYARHPRHGLRPGSYTDDTQMSIAVAEVLLDEPPWSPQAFADRFVHAFKRDPRAGYAACPCGLLESVERVADVAALQARLTHNTPDGANSAVAAALAAHFFAYRLGTPAELAAFLCQHVPGQAGKLQSSRYD